MFFITYLRRELRRRMRQAIFIALALQVFGSPAAPAPSSQSSNLAPVRPGTGGQPDAGELSSLRAGEPSRQYSAGIQAAGSHAAENLLHSARQPSGGEADACGCW